MHVIYLYGFSIHFLREDGFCFGQKSSQMFLRKHVRARVKPGITSPGNGFIRAADNLLSIGQH